MQMVSPHLGLQNFVPPMLYQCLHGGASHELLTKTRDMAGLMKRHRWRSLDSVRRYEKGGRVHQLLGSLSQEQRDHGDACVLRLGDILCETSKPLRPHTVARQH